MNQRSILDGPLAIDVGLIGQSDHSQRFIPSDSPQKTVQAGDGGAESGSGSVLTGRLISRACLDQFDQILKWANRKGLWSIITARASIAAGEVIDGVAAPNVFTDMALRNRFVRMWQQAAA